MLTTYYVGMTNTYSDPDVESLLRQIAMSNGFNAWLDLELRAAGSGHCEIALQITSHMQQHHGFAHGGIVGALADTAMSWAAASVAGDVVTSSYTIQLLRPAREARLLARASVVDQSRRSLSVESNIFSLDADRQQKRVAVGLANIAVVVGGS